ncbi:MAG: ornithine cyclodeaminase family protein [Pseudomonadota bacterium]
MTNPKKTPVLFMTEDELRDLAVMDAEALQSIENAFIWIAEDRVEMPPIMHMGVPENNGDLDIKSAYVRGEASVAVKVAAGFFDNPKQGLPSSSGMVVVVSAKTGRCEAVFLDNAYLTDLRTGLAGAVAAKHLAPEAPCELGVVGAGVQGRFQAEGVALVRDVTRIRVADLSEERLAAYKAEMEAKLGVPVETTTSAEDVVRQSDVIVTTTPSKAPIVKADWLKPGQHITCMGADLPGKQEIDPAVFARADIIAADKPEQSRTHGELQHVGKDTSLKTTPVALGDIARGKAQGRQAAEQISICDLSGVGVQDTAIALHVLRAAAGRSVGQIFET